MNQVHLTTRKDQRKEHINQVIKTEKTIKSDSNVVAKPQSCSFCSKDLSLDCCKTFQENLLLFERASSLAKDFALVVPKATIKSKIVRTSHVVSTAEKTTLPIFIKIQRLRLIARISVVIGKVVVSAIVWSYQFECDKSVTFQLNSLSVLFSMISRMSVL